MIRTSYYSVTAAEDESPLYFWAATAGDSVEPRHGYEARYADAVAAAYQAAESMSTSPPVWGDRYMADQLADRLDPLAPVRNLLHSGSARVPLWWATKWSERGEPLRAAYEESADASTILMLSGDVTRDAPTLQAVVRALTENNLSFVSWPNGVAQAKNDAERNNVRSRPASRALRAVLPDPPPLAQVMRFADLCGKYTFLVDDARHDGYREMPFCVARSLCLAGDFDGAVAYAERVAKERMET